MSLQFGSVCSGIEAASAAWKPIGWNCRFVSEIEPFPCYALNFHYGASRPMFMPDPASASNLKEKLKCKAAILAVSRLPEKSSLPNFGDMNRFRDWTDAAIDVLVGGTPCQAFSVAGLRKGLADPRGNLTLVYLGVLDRYRPRWMVWENVPGVLSNDEGRSFNAI